MTTDVHDTTQLGDPLKPPPAVDDGRRTQKGPAIPVIVKPTVTDTLAPDRPPLSRIFKEVYEIRGGFVELDVPDIVPGEPIQVGWRIVLDSLNRGAPDVVDVRFLVEGILIHQRLGMASANATVGGFIGVLTERNFQREVIVIADQAVARSIYRIADDRATRRLELKVEVRGPAGAGPAYTGSTELRLRREATDAAWWEWRVPAFESIAWSTGYSLVGDFVNRLRFARVELATAELSEVRSEENPAIDPCGYVPVQIQTRNSVAVGARGSFEFSLLQDWHWIMPASYLIHGPMNKTFAYGVFFHFTDEFGNIYDGQCSTRRSRHVGVSKGKRLAGVAAQTAAANAAFWAATLLGWVVAAGWYGVATAMGLIAKDPPAPDLAFQDDVEPELPPMPPWTDGVKKAFPATLELLDLAAELAALENGRTKVRAKLMGARLASDRAGVQRQTGAYHAFEGRMSEIAAQLERTVPSVRDEVEAEKKFHPALLRPALDAMAELGLSGAARTALEQQDLADELVHGLALTCASRDAVALARDNGMSLVPFVVSLVRFVDEVRREQPRVLAGERHVHVEADTNRSFARVAQEQAYDAHETPLRSDRRRGCC
jgi:hypothetical protein